MAQEIHFEIFRRQGSKGGWVLHDVATNREAALLAAELLMADQKATGVKVLKETYNPETGDFLSLKIFEDGHTRSKTDAAAEDLPHALPCFQPDDLYSYHARATIARLLCDYLARNKLTVTELIHRADALEKFEATGTLFQHAIQKIAVAQAATTATPVQHIMKSLNELVTKAIHRVYRDERRGAFPALAPGRFAAAAEKLAKAENGGYLLNGAIARHLRACKSWNEKTLALLAILDEAQGDGDGARLLAACVDSLIAEILHGSAALHELIGEHANLAEAVMSLVLLFLGEEATGPATRSGLLAVTRRFAAGELPTARTAIANRILAELKSVRRLCPGSLGDEFKMLKRIANKLVLGEGKYLSHDDLIAAFALRSRRCVAHECVQEYLADAALPDDKLERLLFVEENIVGAENKRQLVAFIMPIVTSAPFETHFAFGKTPVISRLQRLAELQARVRHSGFADTQRQEIADLLDRIAGETEARAKLFEGIESKAIGHAEKAAALLRLCGARALTEGRLSARARQLILGHLGQPGFLVGYTAHVAQTSASAPNAEAAMAELVQTLRKAGIAPELGLKAIAA